MKIGDNRSKAHLSSLSFVKRQDHIALKEIEKEGILLNLKNGHYFVTNELGLFIWKLLDRKKSLEQIAQRIVSRYEGTKTVVLASLIVFVKILYRQKLVTIVE